MCLVTRGQANYGGYKVSKDNPTILVAGGGGFIGGHLVRTLREQDLNVRVADIKPIADWYQVAPRADSRQLDLSRLDDCRQAVAGVDVVYDLAADMGGMGFIETHKAECMLSILINTHLLIAARDACVERYFFSSSACVYNAEKQLDADVTALKEEDAYPAMAEDGYGWEKLFSERMCRHFLEDFGLQTRVARYHNVYGPSAALKVVARRRPPHCAGRSRGRCQAATRSRFGVTASRRAASCTSTTVSREP